MCLIADRLSQSDYYSYFGYTVEKIDDTHLSTVMRMI